MFGLVKKLLTGNKYGIPREVVGKWQKGAKHTPDFAELEQHKKNLVFMYDFPGSLPDPKYSEAYTVDPMIMVKTTTDIPFPVVIKEIPRDVVGGFWSRKEPAPIFGSIYELSAAEIKILDNDRENGVMFVRERIKISIPYIAVRKRGDEIMDKIPMTFEKRCYTYLGPFSYWNFQQLSDRSYTLFKTRRLNLAYQEHYRFTRNDI